MASLGSLRQEKLDSEFQLPIMEQGKVTAFQEGCVCVCDDFCGWTVTAFQEVCVGVCVCVCVCVCVYVCE